MARSAGDIVQQKGSTNAPAIVKEAMKARGYTQIMLAQKLGYKGQNSISGALSGRNMQINILIAMLDALDFDVIIKDRNSGNRENVWKVQRIEEDDVNSAAP